MSEHQEIKVITKDVLKEEVRDRKEWGARLVQICCSKLGEQLQFDYSFEHEHMFTDLRFNLPCKNPEVPSITDIYWAAFTYENELHDLYGVSFDGLALNYKGNFYRIEQKTPFNIIKKEREPAKE